MLLVVYPFAIILFDGSSKVRQAGMRKGVFLVCACVDGRMGYENERRGQSMI